MYSRILVLVLSVGLSIPSAMASTPTGADDRVSDVAAKMKEACAAIQNPIDCGSNVECKWQDRCCVFDQEGIPIRALNQTILSLGVVVMMSMIFVFIGQLGAHPEMKPLNAKVR